MSAAADSTATAARGEVLAEQDEPAGAVGWRRADLWIALGLLVLTLAIALVTIVRAPEYSRIDEYTHADYAYRIWHGELPAAGDQLGQEMLADWSCRGDQKSRPPECGSYEATMPEEFIYEAYQYNFFHPPVFYGAVAVVAGTLSDTAGLSFVTAARMASAGVAALGAAAVFLAIRSWRVRRVPAAAIGLLTIANPMVAHAAATVNPDSIAMLVGAGAVWVLGRIYVHGRVPIVAAGGIMLLAAGSKVIIAMVLVAVCIVIGIDGARRWFRGERGMGGRMVALAAVCAAVLIAVYVGWSAFQAGRGDPDWENPMTGLSTAGFGAFWPPAMAVATSITNMFGIGGDYWTHPQVNGPGTRLAGKIVGLVGAVVPVLGIVLLRRGSAAWKACLALLIGLLLVPLVVQLQAYLDQDAYFRNMTSRYGLSLLPLVGLVAAMLLEKLRLARWGMAVAAVLVLGVVASATGLDALGEQPVGRYVNVDRP